VITYARWNLQVFVAQCVWWLAAVIGLEQGLANYIDNIGSRSIVTIIPERIPSVGRTVSPIPRGTQEDQRQDQVLKEVEEYLQNSKRQREIVNHKRSRETKTGRITPYKVIQDQFRVSTKTLRKKDRGIRKQALPAVKEHTTTGINEEEIQRRRKTGECLRCAWPSDRKGAHQVTDCCRPIKLDRGTASFNKSKEYQKIKHQQPIVEEDSSDDTSSQEPSDESL
jgi:hypothetical protein